MASITRLDSGSWRALIRRKGVVKSGTFPTKSEAQRWAASVEAAIAAGAQAGTIQAPRSLTLGHLCDAYVADVGARRSVTASLKATAASKELGQVPVRSLNASHFSAYVNRRREEGVTGATIAGDLSHISAVLKWARRVKSIDVYDGFAKEARTALTAARISTRSRERTRLPSPSEIDAICNHLSARRNDDGVAAAIVKFASVTAMRLSEICGIQIEDVRWNEAAVLIRARKHPRLKETNDQLVPLVGDALEIARRQARGRRVGLLFRVNAKTIGTAFRRAVAALKIPDLHFHDLRAAGITALFRAGLPVHLVAIVSGHQDWRVLRRYARLGPQDVHDALAALRT